MLDWFKTWNHERKSRKFQLELKRMKVVANVCCSSACYDPICQEVGCLNQDGFTLRHRIKLLLKRLNDKDIKEEPPIPDNLVQFKDYQ